LDDKTGTNTLGELIEASQWSADKLFYGDLHNFGHIAMCYIHDPDRSHSVLNYACQFFCLLFHHGGFSLKGKYGSYGRFGDSHA
jgi:hypothetical protein